MDWQQVASLVIVGITALLFLWIRLRPRRFSLQRDTHCGCGRQTAGSGSIVFHARKGERPRIIVKSN